MREGGGRREEGGGKREEGGEEGGERTRSFAMAMLMLCLQS